MILPPEASTSTSFQSLHEAGASYARKDRRRARVGLGDGAQYLNGPGVPPSATRRVGTQPLQDRAPGDGGRCDARRRHRVELKASVIHERFVADHGFDGPYQRV